MFENIQNNLKKSKRETERNDKVEKLWSLWMEVHSDSEKAEILNRFRLKGEIYIGAKLAAVNLYKADLEAGQAKLMGPIDQDKVKNEVDKIMKDSPYNYDDLDEFTKPTLKETEEEQEEKKSFWNSFFGLFSSKTKDEARAVIG